MNDEKKGVKKMRTFAKSSKLDNVCYDIRGPVMDEANRMIEQGVEILKLNIGNPAPFGFKAPQELVDMMRGNLENAEGYSDSRGLLKSRQAIVEYCKKKNNGQQKIGDQLGRMIYKIAQNIFHCFAHHKNETFHEYDRSFRLRCRSSAGFSLSKYRSFLGGTAL